jgi:hypothetical protein
MVPEVEEVVDSRSRLAGAVGHSSEAWDIVSIHSRKTGSLESYG